MSDEPEFEWDGTVEGFDWDNWPTSAPGTICPICHSCDLVEKDFIVDDTADEEERFQSFPIHPLNEQLSFWSDEELLELEGDKYAATALCCSCCGFMCLPDELEDYE